MNYSTSVLDGMLLCLSRMNEQNPSLCKVLQMNWNAEVCKLPFMIQVTDGVLDSVGGIRGVYLFSCPVVSQEKQKLSFDLIFCSSHVLHYAVLVFDM